MAVSRPALIGAFVLGGIALVVAAILFFGGTRLFERTIRAVIFFEGSVAGLDVGAPVTFRGVRVGSVERVAVRIAEDATLRIPVHIRIHPESLVEDVSTMEGLSVEALVDAGLRAQLNIESLVTAQLRVDLDFRPDTPATLVAADTAGVPQIPSVPSGIERLRMTLQEIPVREMVEKLLGTLTTMEALAARVDSELTPLLAEGRGTMESATAALQAIERAAAGIDAGMATALRDWSELASTARERLDGTGADAAQVLATADRVGREAERLLASVNGLLEPRARFRTDLDAALRDLAASAASLRSFARTIERDPSAVLRGGAR